MWITLFWILKSVKMAEKRNKKTEMCNKFLTGRFYVIHIRFGYQCFMFLVLKSPKK